MFLSFCFLGSIVSDISISSRQFSAFAAVDGSQVIIAHADLLDSNTQYFVDDPVSSLYEDPVSPLYEDP